MDRRTGQRGRRPLTGMLIGAAGLSLAACATPDEPGPPRPPAEAIAPLPPAPQTQTAPLSDYDALWRELARLRAEERAFRAAIDADLEAMEREIDG